jgi:hypothetical protein
MIQSMFVYNLGAGDIYFTPTIPPIGKQPLDALVATRHDSITSSGIKQAVLERIDDVVTFSFQFVPQSDLTAWKAFMTYALAGGVFAYRPNAADNTVWSEYTLESTEWNPKFISPGWFSFQFQCRLWVGGTVVSGS